MNKLLALWLSCGVAPVLAQQLCPVTITKLETSDNLKAGLFAALASSRSSASWLILNYQNVSSKQVTGIRFSVVYLNSVGEVTHSESLTTPPLKLKPGKSFGIIHADDEITGGRKMQTAGAVARVMFSDGSSWVDDGTASCSSGGRKLPTSLVRNSVTAQSSPAAAAAIAEAGKVYTPEEIADLVRSGQASRCAVVTDPPKATVKIDGNIAGITPIAITLIKHGDSPRVLTISLEGYETIEKSVVPDGKIAAIQVKLVTAKR